MKRVEQKLLGIPVFFDQGYEGISEARGFWRWEEIVVGRKFLSFPPREQQALLLHEAGHRKLRHLEKRLLNLWLLFCRPGRLAELCIEQEYEADRFAAGCGYGHDLARAFQRMNTCGGALHPPTDERIVRLQGYP